MRRGLIYKLSTVTETAGDHKQGKFSHCGVRCGVIPCFPLRGSPVRLLAGVMIINI